MLSGMPALTLYLYMYVCIFGAYTHACTPYAIYASTSELCRISIFLSDMLLSQWSHQNLLLCRISMRAMCTKFANMFAKLELSIHVRVQTGIGFGRIIQIPFNILLESCVHIAWQYLQMADWC